MPCCHGRNGKNSFVRCYILYIRWFGNEERLMIEFMRGVIVQIQLTWRLIRDPRVPLWAKAIPFLAAAYVISPIDIIPDWLIGLGQLDDLGILLGAMRLMESVTPEYIV